MSHPIKSYQRLICCHHELTSCVIFVFVMEVTQASRRRFFPVAKVDVMNLCWHFNTPKGCAMGDSCRFVHELATARDQDTVADGPSRIAATAAAQHKKNKYMVNNPKGYREIMDPRSLLRLTLERNGWEMTDSFEDADLLWNNAWPTPRSQILTKLQHGAALNHLSRETELTHKDRLLETLRRADIQRIVQPPTFILPAEISKLQAAVKERAGSLWIIKPSNKGRGKGIVICPSPIDVVTCVSSSATSSAKGKGKGGKEVEPLEKARDNVRGHVRNTESSHPPGVQLVDKSFERAVVSLYIHNPLLVHNRKFDLRLFALVFVYPDSDDHSKRQRRDSAAAATKTTTTKGNDCSPRVRVFIHANGLARFAPDEYSTEPTEENLSQKRRHMTASVTHGEYDSNMTLDALWDTLSTSDQHTTFPGRDEVWSRIRRVMTLTVQSGLKPIVHATRGGDGTDKLAHRCFSLIGMDVLLDADYRPWLLECNSAPDVSCASKKHRNVRDVFHSVKSQVLADLFEIALTGDDELGDEGLTSFEEVVIDNVP